MTRSRRDDGTYRLTRRGFLAGSAAAAVVAGASTCSSDSTTPSSGGTSTPTTLPPQRARTYFTPHEAAVVEAATARILPGTPEDPGAREAEVVVYIDGLLAVAGGYGEPVYRTGPFVSPDDFDPTVENDDEGEEGEGDDDTFESTPFGVIDRPSGTFDRYGDQSLVTPAEAYRRAIPLLDMHSLERFGTGFVDLDEEQQDAVLTDLEDDAAPVFDSEPTAQDFFALLHRHTVEGMFSDPIYGGNQGMVGWELIGWPAAQRAYTPVELKTEARPRSPQSIEQMHPFNPGDAGRNEHGAELPVAGSDQHRHGGG